MRTVTLDKLSYCSVPVVARRGPICLASCTGFFYKNNDSYYLITNWHNVTGIDYVNRRRTSGTGGSPSELEIPILHKDRSQGIRWKRIQVRLYDNDKNPQWLIHPQFSRSVDVVALELGAVDNEDEIMPAAINEISFDTVNPRIADDVFVLGFPLGIRPISNFPLWKRGSLATEPELDHGDLPRMLIDSSTKAGMSGSPVIIRKSGIDNLVGTVKNDMTLSMVEDFIGVYSGRAVSDKEELSELGIVWKRKVIEEIIQGGAYDDKYYPEISVV